MPPGANCFAGRVEKFKCRKVEKFGMQLTLTLLLPARFPSANSLCYSVWLPGP